nr:hypothetical protein [Agrobacterium tumefaciens]
MVEAMDPRVKPEDDAESGERMTLKAKRNWQTNKKGRGTEFRALLFF